MAQANQKLSELERSLYKDLMDYYSPECYLMTYFYGKKLFFLTQYLRGKLTAEEAEGTIGLITESIPKNLIDFNQKAPVPGNLDGVFESVYQTLCEWSSNTNLKERIKLTESSVLASKKIKICTAPLNVYRAICKILLEANESMASLSQMMFC